MQVKPNGSQPKAAEPCIRYRTFGFRYADAPDWALEGIDLDIYKGEVVLVGGHSGSGKSTLALSLNGAVPHLLEGEATGSLEVFGLDVATSKVSDLAAMVGMVFQDPEVQLFALTVEDEVAMSLESYAVPRNEMATRVQWAMSVCGLTGLDLNAPAKLSGGQQQRVAIAAVLAREPEMLVFDSPTGNLDPVGSRSVYETIRRICDERERTILLIEHDLAPVIDLVDRVVVLEQGRLAFDGPPREAMRQAALLERSGAKVPASVRLGRRLEAAGLVTYPTPPISMEETLAPLPQLSRPPASKPPESTMGAVSQPVIRFEAVTHQYETGHRGIDGIDLDIGPGEFVAICGMNGAGKTTMALHVMGLLKPTSGRVLVNGDDIADKTVAEMARTVGLIFQNPNHQLFNDRVMAEVTFGPRNLGWSEKRIADATQAVLALVGLPSIGDREIESLSIGQKQLVAVASVLIMEPQILILDEPTTGQDERTLAPFMNVVRRLNREGMTVLMITHDMDVTLEYATRMVVMANGEVIADNSPPSIFLQPELLERARLQPPEIFALASRLNGGRPVYVRGLDELEGLIADGRTEGVTR